MHENFLPDVLSYSKAESGSLEGDYYVAVHSETFSTYSLFYYTETFNEENKKLSAVNVFKGEILKDYIYLNRTNYRVYSHHIDYKQSDPQDIRINLTPSKGSFNIYIYKENSIIRLNSTTNMLIGYDWSSNCSELLISKSDSKYLNFGTYYVVITLNNEDTWTNITEGSYYIGITDEKSGYIIHENIPFQESLSQHFTESESFIYPVEIENPIFLKLNVIYGKINYNILIDGNEYKNKEKCQVLQFI